MSQGKIVLLACGSFSPPTPMHLRIFEIARDYIHSLGTHTVIGGVISPVHDAYGKKNLVSAQHRCAMLKLALKTSDWIKLSDWEINQEGWTRTKVTLQHHQDQLDAFLNGTANESDTPPAWLPDEILNEVLNNNVDEPDNYQPSCDDLNNGNNVESNDNSFGRNDNHRQRRVTVKLLCGADLLESFATPNLWADEDLETILGNHGLMVITRSGTNPERFVHESDMLSRFMRNIMLITNWVPNEVSSTVIRRLLARGQSVKYLIDDAIIHYVKQHQLFGTKAIKRSATKYNLFEAQVDTKNSPITPEDISMTSPSSSIMETGSNVPGIKNILISIRDRPTVTQTENVAAKKSRKTPRFFSSINSSHTHSVTPILDLAPKMVYCENMNPIYPGKAVKVVKNLAGQDVVLTDDDEVGNSDDLTVCIDEINFSKNEINLCHNEFDASKNKLKLCNDELSRCEDNPGKTKLIVDVDEKDLSINKITFDKKQLTVGKKDISFGENELASGENHLTKQILCDATKTTSGKKKLSSGKNKLPSGKTQLTFGKNELTSVKDKLTVVKSKFSEELTNLTNGIDRLKLRNENTRDSYKTRSCNDIVKLVLTKHGIHVISDKEAIV